MKLIKHIIEKLYIKVFPERKDEHSLCMMPVPKVITEPYNCETVCNIITLDMFEYNNFTEEQIKRFLVRSMEDNLIDFLTLKRDTYIPEIGSRKIYGEIRVFRRR